MAWKMNTTILVIHYKGKAKVFTFHEKKAFLVELLSKDYIIDGMLPMIHFVPILQLCSGGTEINSHTQSYKLVNCKMMAI